MPVDPMWIKAGSDVLSAFAKGAAQTAPSQANQSISANFDSSGFTVATGGGTASAQRSETPAAPTSPVAIGMLILGLVAWSKLA